MASVELICSDVSNLSDRIRAAVRAATAEHLLADSQLPGWDRAHVVAHIAGFSHGMARQLEYALRGDQIEQYTGGMAERNADIEERAALPGAELMVVIDEALDRLAAAIGAMTQSDWDRPIIYRQGSARDGLQGAWRELAIHLTDLDLGHGSSEWSDAFSAHLFDFLVSRVPEDMTLAGDGFGVGGGPDEVRVEGTLQDFAAWLAGREPDSSVKFSSGVEPDLLPWPARKN